MHVQKNIKKVRK